MALPQKGQQQLHELTLEFDWKKLVYVPMATEYLSYPVFQQSPVLQKCKVSIIVQGNLEEIQQKPVQINAIILIFNYSNSVCRFF
jgi:hypothetical protein